MSGQTVPAKLPLVERISDWFNPILVKETRQALKSRQFVATFLLMLLASWLIAVLGVVLMSPGLEHADRGGLFFMMFYIVLAFAVFLVVPFYHLFDYLWACLAHQVV